MAGKRRVSALRALSVSLLLSTVALFALAVLVSRAYAIAFYAVLALALGILGIDQLMNRRAATASKSATTTIMAPAPSTSQPSLLNNRFEVTQQLKSGGMAEIMLARDHSTGADCVVKTPRQGTSNDDYNITKLRLEAAHLPEFNHPNIVKYIDTFTSDGRLYLVEEYIDGQDLLSEFSSAPAVVTDAIAWGGQILSAMQAIHEAGFVHRDINPKNIMLRSNRNIAIIDFGTIKPKGANPVGGNPGTSVMAHGFTAPEQFQGYSDESCDLYGVGGTLFYLLTSEVPGNVPDPASFLKTRGVPDRQANCIAQSMQPDPRKRFRSAAAMKKALSG